MINAETYWFVGGCDEDFVGNYGHTDVHFWYRYKLNFQNRVIVHHDIILEQRHIDTCNETTITNAKQLNTCIEAKSKLNKIPKNTKRNTELLKTKKVTGCWSNEYLRFPYIIERW